MPPIVFPFGLSPLGLAVPRPGGPLKPAPAIAAELHDPLTRDVASLLKSADVIDDQVWIALTVRRDSGAALGTTGQRFRDITKLGSNVEQLLDTEVRTSLATLVERGDISIDSIAVNTDSSIQYAEVLIEYTNRRTTGQRNRRLTIPIEASPR